MMQGRSIVDIAGTSDRNAQLEEYARMRDAGNALTAGTWLCDRLRDEPLAAWLECGQALILRRDSDGAIAVLSAALDGYPDSADVRYALAGVLWQAKRAAAAEPLLRDLLEDDSGNATAAFLIARMLKEQGRMLAVETTLQRLFEARQHPVETVIQAVELLDDCNRKRAAAELCESAIAAGAADPRLHAYAGMLSLHLGRFGRVRGHYRFALENDARALDWQVATALATVQHYKDDEHPDFELFRSLLLRPGLSAKARASLLFALGKAHDDIARPAQATEYFRHGNAIVDDITQWSRKNWRRGVEARLNSKPLPRRTAGTADCVPIFIVGMPRSGTTLIAHLLSRHPDVCNRGELGWLPFLAQQLALAGGPTPTALDRAASTYIEQLRQDDSNARWFIDKQPLNFLHVDLAAALFPQARIIHCDRNARDTALSVWMQYFVGPENNFAYDFANIAAVTQDCARLMASARKKEMLPIQRVQYEDAVEDPDACIRLLADWLGLPEFDWASRSEIPASVSTASAWQVRQPVHTRSLGRWHGYAPYVPELQKLFPA